jgi:hypothetical protein
VAFAVVYDACVLYPAPLRDLLIRRAAAGVVRAQWTESILDESFENIIEQRPIPLTTNDYLRCALPHFAPA